MTYNIHYIPKDAKKDHRGYTMFDIEYYQTYGENKEKWFSEIHCLPCVEGIARFMKDKLTEEDFDLDKFNWDEIARECQEALDWMEECLFTLTPPPDMDNNRLPENI